MDVTLYNVYNYLPMLELHLTHVSKRGYMCYCIASLDILNGQYYVSAITTYDEAYWIVLREDHVYQINN